MRKNFKLYLTVFLSIELSEITAMNNGNEDFDTIKILNHGTVVEKFTPPLASSFKKAEPQNNFQLFRQQSEEIEIERKKTVEALEGKCSRSHENLPYSGKHHGSVNKTSTDLIKKSNEFSRFSLPNLNQFNPNVLDSGVAAQQRRGRSRSNNLNINS